ncbi:hypothetical protein NZD89_28050 (plasmid) [Alicyclobacillus fastidiosus]|uniref:Uncharacterized protein n=1 Tax=Alicyclobacillus fastidiosus TaxID=392011 RepID=A0ABY6ZPK2_9BACL|nr:hypothetical protein [Alicyclobacillus fastidiosus]WAH44903.1 hypothetical protein NZD89_28050 [Alicyclobacillus fastidiosus]GMA65662.1 hypothetical protein GCM10025859_61020 [Alicyclobacillus fastidiosus]
MDETTGQTVGAVTSTPATVQYANANAETDEFEAFITDGYENIGAPSNTVSVQWVGATVTASPTLLPINQSSTITATAQNKPSTDWLILFNESTGQVLGSTQGSTISTTQTESTAQTDAYLAYVSPSNDVSGAYVTSDPVSVDWYGVTLTATPVSLPVGEETQLTAATQNLPAGYVLDIEDQTTGKVLATGDLSQTTLTTTDTQSSPQTDTYIARIVQPPKTGYGLWAAVTSQADMYTTDNGWSDYDPSSSPNGTEVYENGKWIPEGDPNGDADVTSLVYDAQDGYTWAGTANSGVAYWDGTKWVNAGSPSDSSSIVQLVYNSTSGQIWAQTATGVSYWNGSTWVETTFPTWSGAEPAYLTTGPSNEMILVIQQWQDQAEIDVWNGTTWTIKDTMSFSGNIPGTWGINGVAYSNGQLYIIEHYETTHRGSASTVEQSFDNIYGTQFSTLSSTSAWTENNVSYQFDWNSYNGYYYDDLITGGSSGSGNINGTTRFIGTSPSGDIYIQVDGWIEGISQRGGGLIEAAPKQMPIYTWNGSTNVITGYQTELETENGEAESQWYAGQTLFYSLPHAFATDGLNDYVGWGANNYSGMESYDVTENFGDQDSYAPTGSAIGPTDNNVSSVVALAWNGNSSMDSAVPVPLQTSDPVSVTWYQWQLSLNADPTQLPAGSPTTLTATSSGAPSGAYIEIYDETTNTVVGTSPANATLYSTTYTENSPTTDQFVAYFIDQASGNQLQNSNTQDVEWTQIPLTLSDAEVYHTDAWLANLNAYNAEYQQTDPSLVRSLSDFWAGEQLDFKVLPSIKTIAQAQVTIEGLSMSPYAPDDPPVNFWGPVTIPLTLDSTTGYLEGNTDPTWQPWMQYIEDGTYQVEFYVKSDDNQVSTALASFTIDAPWVSGDDPRSYYHEHQTY